MCHHDSPVAGTAPGFNTPELSLYKGSHRDDFSVFLGELRLLDRPIEPWSLTETDMHKVITAWRSILTRLHYTLLGCWTWCLTWHRLWKRLVRKPSLIPTLSCTFVQRGVISVAFFYTHPSPISVFSTKHKFKFCEFNLSSVLLW